MKLKREEIKKKISEKNEELFHHYFFPIIGNKTEGKIENLYGTASYIGNAMFITAGHCLKNISSEEIKLVLFYEENGYRGEEIINVEHFEEVDISLFQIADSPPNIKSYKWANQEPVLFTEVFSCGFPHGFDAEKHKIYSKGLKGYVHGLVSDDKFIKGKDFLIIETSFACPRGISGSPLVEWNENKIHGIIVGNTKNSIQVFSKREYIKENETYLYEVEETLNLGMAISNQSIFTLKSKILNNTIKDYLISNNLLL